MREKKKKGKTKPKSLTTGVFYPNKGRRGWAGERCRSGATPREGPRCLSLPAEGLGHTCTVRIANTAQRQKGMGALEAAPPPQEAVGHAEAAQLVYCYVLIHLQLCCGRLFH